MLQSDPVADSPVETDCLIVGAGPAGVSLASFLINYGLKVMLVSEASGTSFTPRAHLINAAGLECMRDIGLEDECVRMGNKGDAINSIRWCQSLTGKEFGRIHSWGAGPTKMGESDDMSPCEALDLPQNCLEPILLRYASTRGAIYMFNTTFESFEEDSEGCLTTVINRAIGQRFQVRSRYLFGCDGAKGTLGRQLGLTYKAAASGGVACNIFFNADVADIMKHQKGHLHWIMQPESDQELGIAPIMRMVKPWHQWMLVCLPKPGQVITVTDDKVQLENRIRTIIGLDSVDVEVINVSWWRVNETNAETYSKGNVFCLGDAVHRHPPNYGLGSNTCLQDAYNLAWKIAMVHKGLAGPALLDTYTLERHAVGEELVKRSNECFRQSYNLLEALGMMEETVEERVAANKELAETTERGRIRRQKLHNALEERRDEGDSLGIMMNQWYTSSAVYLDDEPPREPFAGNFVRDVCMSTYPGTRLPHAWLSNAVPGQEISTQDLAGKNRFSLFTGHGGERWVAAAKTVGDKLGFPIKTWSIGWGLDYVDKYRDWKRKNEIEEDGCVLVRPDRYVAWRSKAMISTSCEEKLELVLRSILSR